MSATRVAPCSATRWPNLLAYAGYDVTREYYINDAGSQIDTLARSAFLRYREALGEDIGEIPAGLYPGDYLKPVGAGARSRSRQRASFDMDEAAWMPIVKSETIDAMMALIREDLALLNVSVTRCSSPNAPCMTAAPTAFPRSHRMLDKLRARGLVYEGTAPAAQGRAAGGLGRPRADPVPRHRLRRRHRPAAHQVGRLLHLFRGRHRLFRHKYLRGFKEMVYVLGADHARLCQAAGGGRQGRVRWRVAGDCAALPAGEAVPRRRAGADVEARRANSSPCATWSRKSARDPVRFMMLFRKNEAPLDFDFKKVTEQSKDNPVFYVQYAHARMLLGIPQCRGLDILGVGAPEELS
jgi:arginyl-tRNA synthetase